MNAIEVRASQADGFWLTAVFHESHCQVELNRFRVRHEYLQIHAAHTVLERVTHSLCNQSPSDAYTAIGRCNEDSPQIGLVTRRGQLARPGDRSTSDKLLLDERPERRVRFWVRQLVAKALNWTGKLLFQGEAHRHWIGLRDLSAKRGKGLSVGCCQSADLKFSDVLVHEAQG